MAKKQINESEGQVRTIGSWQESVTGFSSIYNSMSEGLALHEIINDKTGKGIDYYIIDINPAYEKITGLNRETIIGRKATEAYSVDEAPYIDIYSKVASTGKPVSFETYFPPMKKRFNISVFSPGKGKFGTIFQDITERRNLENQIRYLADIFQSITDAVIVVDLTYKITSWNKPAEQMYGWSADEVSGRFIREIVQTQTDGEKLKQIYQTIREGRTRISEHVQKTKDGCLINVECNSMPLLDSAGKTIGYVTINRNITDRKLAEEALLESERNLAEAQRVAQIGSWKWDIHTGDVQWSAELYSIYGLEHNTFTPTMQSFAELIHPDDRNRVGRLVQEIVDTGRTVDFEFRIIRPDGSIRILGTRGEVTARDKDGKPRLMVGINQDITERKRIDETLQIALVKYKTLFNCLPVAFPQSEFPSVKALKEKHPVENVEMGVVRTDNTISWLNVSATPIPLKGYGVLVTYNDISERKQTEDALRESENKYHKLFNSIIEGFCIIEIIFDENKKPVDYRFLEINSVFEKQTGLHNARGRLMSELAPGQEDYWYEIYGKIALTGEPMRFENEAKALNRWFEVTAFRTDKPESRRVAICFNDITERKKAEEALRKSEEKFSTVFKNSPNAITITRLNDGKIIEGNDSAFSLFGYNHGEVIGKTTLELGIWPDAGDRLSLTLALASKGYVQNEDFVIKKKDGTLVPVNLSASLIQVENQKCFLSSLIDLTERKKAEEALRESEEKLWSVLNATRESIYMFNRKGIITMSNSVGLERKHSSTSDEVIGHHFTEFISASVAEVRQQKLEEIFKSGKPVDFEDERDGRFFYHNFFPVFKDSKVVQVVNYSSDITERKKYINKLKESEERLRTIAESLPVMISIFRISDSTFSFVNEHHEKTFGYEKGSLVNNRVPDFFFYKEDRENLANLLKDSGNVNNIEYKVKKNDGTPFWIMASILSINYGNEPSYLISSIDITETKKTQERILQANHTLNAHSKSSKVMMHAKNEIDYLNQVCNIINHDCGYRMVWIGYAQNDRRKSVKPIVHCGFDLGYIDKLNISWADNERGRGPTGTAIRTGKPTICKNMQTDPAFEPWKEAAIKRGYASSLVLPFTIDGKPFGAVSIYSKEPDPFSESEIELLTDLVDDLAYGISFLRLEESEKAATKVIIENEAKLKELIATKDKFFNIVAHDLKNPFTSMLGSSELLYDNIDAMTPKNIKDLALILYDSAKGGYSILLNLLDWSRSQTGQLNVTPQTINLKDIIDENISNLQLPATIKGITINYESAEDINLTADKNMLHTILRNLLSNALKYTHKNGKVVISAEVKPDFITIFIKDNGVGIPEERLDKLFRLDMRNSMPGTQNEQGTGLGLKLCKEFVEKHGGTITVESTEGKGSTFSFTIPVNNAS